jgi:hypothetical protein
VGCGYRCRTPASVRQKLKLKLNAAAAVLTARMYRLMANVPHPPSLGYLQDSPWIAQLCPVQDQTLPLPLFLTARMYRLMANVPHPPVLGFIHRIQKIQTHRNAAYGSFRYIFKGALPSTKLTLRFNSWY